MDPAVLEFARAYARAAVDALLRYQSEPPETPTEQPLEDPNDAPEA